MTNVPACSSTADGDHFVLAPAVTPVWMLGREELVLADVVHVEGFIPAEVATQSRQKLSGLDGVA